MKKVLVLSDNYALVSFVQNIKKNNEEYSIDYHYSSINKNPEALVSLGMEAINVKDEAVIDFIIKNYDLVISAHCKQIFPGRLVNNIRCINVHPGLNPYNRGWFPQVFSIINKLPIGCTIHEMDEDVDHGKIIYQRSVNIEPNDDSFNLYNKIQEVEKELLSENFDRIIFGEYEAVDMLNDGNYNGIKDFNKLCKLDLGSIGTLGEHIDLLRALTHSSYKNAHFKQEGKHYWVRISIECEND